MYSLDILDIYSIQSSSNHYVHSNTFFLQIVPNDINVLQIDSNNIRSQKYNIVV